MSIGLAPVIETERLRLRPHQAEDWPDCVAMWTDPIVTRYTIGAPSAPPRTWLRVLSYRGHWALLGYGYWAVEERATGRYVGELGFADFKRDVQPSIEGMPEIGWALISQAHGKGYATEGLLAAVAWGDHHFGVRSTVCIIHRDNHPSLRVAWKLGYRKVLRVATDEQPDAMLIRPAAGRDRDAC